MIKEPRMFTKKYDLHCHSTASDGVLAPGDVVLRAVEMGVRVLALTDHDTVNGLAEAREVAEKHDVTFINGVEISTRWNNKDIHVVGLGFDMNDPELQTLLQQQQQFRHQRALAIGEKLAELGIPNAYEGAKKLSEGEVTRAHYARYLVEAGVVKDVSQAFKRYLAQGKKAYINPSWCDIPTAIATIQKAGGKAVLAHPLRYELSRKKFQQLIADFKAWNGDAMEVAGCGQNPQQRQHLLALAEAHALKASGGSDFHYPCGWRELGKGLALPEGCDFILSALI